MVASTTHLNGNLPAELTSFVGRRRETAEVRALMSTARMVTLVGTGGVGKTRLARRVAAKGVRAFHDGVWQVELASLREPALLIPTIAAVLGLREQTETWTIQALRERLRPRHLLILLDNCEHLVSECAEVVDQLLQGCPQLQVLATSREALGIRGEHAYTVQPLSVPDEERTPMEAAEGCDSVRLFLDRATEVCPAFVMDETNADAVVGLCKRLEGLPLAIELAASWLRTLPPAELLHRLTEHHHLLSRGQRGLPPRQQSLRSLVDWSYQLCDDEEQSLWRMAAVFAHGFELEALDLLCQRDNHFGFVAVDVVDRLVAKSILFADHQADNVRFRMPEIVREYGFERLEETGEDLSIRVAHRDWCVEMANRASRDWVGPDQLLWFGRIRRELPNIRTALEFSLTQEEGEVEVVQLITSLTNYWIALGFLSEVTHWLDRSRRSPGLTANSRLSALITEAFLATVQGNESLARTSMAEGWTLTPGIASDAQVAWLTFVSGLGAMYADDQSAARKQLDEARERFEAVEDVNGLVMALCARTVTEATSDDPGDTHDRFSAYLQMADSHYESWTRSYTLWAVAFAHWRGGDATAAKETLRQSLRLRAPFDDEFALGQGLELLAWIVAAEGRDSQAATLLGRADRAFYAVGSSVGALRYLVEGHQECERVLRKKLGINTFRSAYERGQHMRLADYSMLADGVGSVATRGEQEVTKKGHGPSPLTPRENEVAELIAEGFSNKEIAKRLLITQRTAETHVENILVKSGFTSRTQVATWVAGRRQPL